MSERSEQREATQLRLLAGKERADRKPGWQLDERTRRAGLRGVAEAREVLRRARPPEPKQPAAVRKAS